MIPYSLYGEIRRGEIAAAHPEWSPSMLPAKVADYCARWPDGCPVPAAPVDAPVIRAVYGSDGQYHPMQEDGSLRCQSTHGIRQVNAPGERARAEWRVRPTRTKQRWMVEVPRRERCGWAPWPGPADGVGVGHAPFDDRDLQPGGAPPLRLLWLRLLAVQQHRCAICGGVPQVVDADVDGVVRGVTCRPCRGLIRGCLHPRHCLVGYLADPPGRNFRWHLGRPIRVAAP